jgi:hypothetical protein
MAERANAQKGPRAGARGEVAFRSVAEGLYELTLGPRVAIDLLVTLDGDVFAFVRVDGELLAEIPVAGQA